MKSILFLAMTAVLLVGCASKENKNVSEADQERQEQFSRLEANSYRVR